MNIDITQEQTETVPQATTGARLRKARENMGFTRQVIAERLCLTVSIIRGIEEDKAQSSLTPLFFRGYVRSYARLVDIPEDELLSELKNDLEVVLTPKIPSMQPASRRKRKKRDSWLIYFTWFIIAVVLGLTGVWWWQNYKAQQEEFVSMIDNSANQQNNERSIFISEPDVSASNNPELLKNFDGSAAGIPVVAVDNEAGQSVSLLNDNDKQVIDTSSAGGVVAAISDSARNNENNANAVSADGPVSLIAEDVINDTDALTMSFSSDCWLEVADASGKTLFHGIQQTGSKLNLTGKEPYKLVIGVPSAVQIQYQGKEIDMSNFVKARRTARFMIP